MSKLARVTVEEIKLGQIVLASDLASSLPLEHTDVVAQVLGPLVSVSVTQRFGNPLNEAAEIDYLFPLPHQAAIVDFELRVGERRIKGELQELEQAVTAYEQARQEGKRAGLLEQRRPNLFSIRIANVLPAENILATMRYQARLNYDDGDYEFLFPMGITPKYHSSDHSDGAGEAAGTDAPLAAPDEPIGPVEITLSVDAGAPAGDPTSPSHPIDLTRLDERRFTVRLAGQQIPDHDFVLRYPVTRDAVATMAWTGADYFMATVLPPVMDEEASTPPREFVFVLDRSGSMQGQPIAQARNALRACLRTLNQDDLFRILLFDHQLEWFRSEPSSVTQAEVDAADAYLARVNGRGGTKIVAALKAALTLPADPERMRYVVFMTDGAVSAEERALDEVRRDLGKTRVFTFGIGPSVNRALLAKLASLGRGTAEFLQLNEDIEGAIIRFQDRVSFPVLTDLSLRWENGQAWDLHPARLPDLYVGQPLEIVGRVRAQSGGTGRRPITLTVSGRRAGAGAGGAVEMQVALPAASQPEPALVRAWARAQVDDLLEGGASRARPVHQLRGEIIGLALEHGLVTPYTAFVAVDSEIALQDGRARPIHVAQPLPQGLELEGFGRMPSVQLSMMPPGALLRSAAPVASAKGMLRDVRARMRRKAPQAEMAKMSVEAYPPPIAGPTPSADDRVQGTLRWLARTQNVNGSWRDDVEMTAAALLAYVRAGQNSKDGHYRPQVKRAFDWLRRSRPAGGFPAFVRAVALAELAAATGAQVHQGAAQLALKELVEPRTKLETAALARASSPAAAPPGVPDTVSTLNDLRLAALCHAPLAVPKSLREGKRADLVRIWAAALGNVQVGAW